MKKLDANYWSDRYHKNETAWDLGEISPPLKAYFDQLIDKNIKILLPGCGRGHEGIYLWKNGFKNVHFADFSLFAIQSIKKALPNLPDNQLLYQDFFKIDGTFDLIIEQTMFCAIDPKLREKYVEKVKNLLHLNGKLIGVLFNREFENGPPFGGSISEYQTLFTPHFSEVKLEKCYNSIAPRQGSEVFIRIRK